MSDSYSGGSDTCRRLRSKVEYYLFTIILKDLSLLVDGYIIVYGVVEHWINLRFVFYKIKRPDNPRDNADMSNEKDLEKNIIS